MSKSNKKNISTATARTSKQEDRRIRQERQNRQTRYILIGTVVLVAALFALLFYMASKDASSNNGNAGAPSPVSFDYGSLPRLGDVNAPAKLVEFGDFKCPACATFAGVIKPQIVQEYIEQGKASLYFVNMAFIGPDSETASLAALSVYHQNSEAFWKYYDALYANQGEEAKEWATADFLVSLAEKEKLDIDYELLRKDIENKTYADELKRDIATAQTANVTSTPSLFINGYKLDEPFNTEDLAVAVDEAVKAAAAP